ncbi:unnamed protein product [Oikopleura dioica]|uniref:Uncharacterized protein n=1 Tax=Oikopleura dioica TaxID=34765 RepID=E4YDI2_OIKDI|nr:unnamed protein product [Oikopleura dioica]
MFPGGMNPFMQQQPQKKISKTEKITRNVAIGGVCLFVGCLFWDTKGAPIASIPYTREILGSFGYINHHFFE